MNYSEKTYNCHNNNFNYFSFNVSLRTQLKDGGTVEYKSLTYKISKVKRLISEEEAEKEGKVQNYDRGIIVELFGFEIYNDVE